jgi:aspartyl-tRNA(Asn)/glutamyl-tRNA(Gln) amidotransferase subunit A
MNAIADMTAIDLAAAIRIRNISPVEAVEAALARIEERRELNAFITICSERSRAEARHAETAIARGAALGPLHGIPFSVKDLTNTEGVTTTQGSALFAQTVPAADAVALARGTDGGGSIRIPAACCGVVGLKATLGAIPNLQPPDLFGANSFVGPMARNVADIRMMFDVLVGPDRRDPYGQVLSFPRRALTRGERPRIAFLLRCGNILDSEVEAVVVSAMAKAETLGMIVEPIELDLVSLEPHFLVLLRSLLLARLGAHASRLPDKLDPTLIATIEAGRAYSASDMCEAQFARTTCFAKIQDILADSDLIASPTLSAPALPVGLDPHGRVTIAGQDAGTMRGAWYPYTYPFNLTGHPALSLPCGISAADLPIGLQLVGRWHEDHYLLDVAQALEASLDLEPWCERCGREVRSREVS